jgi:hypothetical protein
MALKKIGTLPTLRYVGKITEKETEEKLKARGLTGGSDTTPAISSQKPTLQVTGSVTKYTPTDITNNLNRRQGITYGEDDALTNPLYAGKGGATMRVQYEKDGKTVTGRERFKGAEKFASFNGLNTTGSTEAPARKRQREINTELANTERELEKLAQRSATARDGYDTLLPENTEEYRTRVQTLETKRKNLLYEQQRNEAEMRALNDKIRVKTIIKNGDEELFKQLYDLTYQSHGESLAAGLGSPTALQESGTRNQMAKLREQIAGKGYDVDAFLDAYTNKVNAEKTEEKRRNTAEFAREHPLPGTAIGIGAGLLGGASSAMGVVMDEGRENSPYNMLNVISEAALGAVGENARAVGEIVGRNMGLNDKASKNLGTAFNWMYNAGTSAAQSYLAMKTGVIGEAVLGLNAATQTYNEALNNGMDKGQALAYGAVSGFFETLFEHLSIDKLRIMDASKAPGIKGAIVNIFKQTITEASEEAATTTANEIYDYLFNGGFSAFQRSVAKYKDQGMSEADAKKQYAKDFVNQLIQDAVIGGMSGAMGAGRIQAKNAITNTAGNISAGRSVQKAAAQTEGGVQETVKPLMDVADEKTKAKLGALTEKSGAYKTGRAVNAALREAETRQHKALTDALVKQGYSNKESETLAESYGRILNGKNATVKDLQTVFFDNRGVANVLKETAENDRDKIMERVEQFRTNVLDAVRKNKLDAATESSVKKELGAKAVDDAKRAGEISRGAKTAIKNKTTDTLVETGTAAQGKSLGSVQVFGFQKTGDGVQLVVDKESGATAPLSEITVTDEKRRPVYERLMQMIEGGRNRPAMTVEAANLALAMMETEETDSETFLTDWQAAYNAGAVAQDPDTYMLNFRHEISDTALNTAYRAGAGTYVVQPGVTRIGTEELSKNQKEELMLLDHAFRQEGLKVLVTDRLYTKDGDELRTLYGDTDGGVITVALQTGMGDSNILAQTGWHEAYHWIGMQSEYGQGAQKNLTGVVIAAIKQDKTQDYDALYRQRAELYPNATKAQIEEEIAAQYIGTLKTKKDAEALSKEVAKEAEKDPTLWQKLADHLAEFVQRIKKRLKDMQAQTGDLTVKAALEAKAEKAEEILTYFDVILKNVQEEKRIAAEKGETVEPAQNTERKFSFAGRNAQNADLTRLSEAEQLEKDGEDSETIRQKTGWVRANRRDWVFEFSDRDMQADADGGFAAANDMRAGTSPQYLGDYVQHDKLFEAYPDMKYKPVVFADLPAGQSGMYDEQTGFITIANAVKGNETELKKAFVHEIQHAIQAYEGMAGGSTPAYWAEKTKGIDLAAEARRKLDQILKSAGADDRALFNRMVALENEVDNAEGLSESEREEKELEARSIHRELSGKAWYDDAQRYRMIAEGVTDATADLYARTAGEIMARDAEARMDLTDEERKEKRPDVDRTDVVFADGEVIYSKDYASAKKNNALGALLAKVKKGLFNEKESVSFGIVDKKTANLIYNEIGVNAVGFEIIIAAKQLDHILIRHGKNGKADHSLANDADVMKMDYILNHYDKLEKAGRTTSYWEFRNGRNRSARTIKLEKNIGSKSYYVIEAVPDTKAKQIYIVSAYIGTPSNKIGVTQLNNAKSPAATSESATVITPENSISQNDEKSQEKNESRVLNEKAMAYAQSVRYGSREDWERLDLLEDMARELYVVEGPRLSKTVLQKIAKKHIKSGTEKRNVETFADRLEKADKMLSEGRNMDVVFYGLYNMATEELANAGHWDDTDSIVKDFRNEFRVNGKPVRIYLPTDIYNTVAEYYGGRAAFRRRMFGKMTVTDDPTKGGMGLDEFYDSLRQGNYGLEETTDPSTQIANMLALYNMNDKLWVDDTVVALQGESLEELATDEAFAMLQELLTEGRKISAAEQKTVGRLDDLAEQAKTARRDRIRAEIKAADADMQKQIEKLSKKDLDTIEFEIEKEKIKNAFRLRAIRQAHQRRMERVQQQMQKQYAEDLERGRLERDIKRNLKNLQERFTRESDSNNVPQALKQTVSDFLLLFSGDRNMMTAKVANELTYLAQNLSAEEAVSEEYESMFGRFDEDLKEQLEELSHALTFKTDAQGRNKVYTNKLTFEQIKTLAAAAEHIRFLVESANEAWVNGRQQKISSLGDRVIARAKDAKRSGFQKLTANTVWDDFINNKMLTPIYFFKERLGGVLGTLYDDFRDGQDEWYRRSEAGKEYLAKMKETYHYDEWKDKTFKFHFDAVGVREAWDAEMSVEDVLQIYATAKREILSGRESRHLMEGGIVLESELQKQSLKEKLQGLKQKGAQAAIDERINRANADRHQLTMEDLLLITNKLTDKQKAYADKIVDFMSTTCAGWGNETSMKLAGIKKFGEDYYFPYQTARNYLYTRLGVSDDTRLKNAGFTKRTVYKASSPLLVSGFTEVAMGHVQQMALYSTMTVPLDTLQRVINYQPMTLDAEGNEVKAQANVKTTLTNAYGKYTMQYIQEFVKNVNGGIRSDSLDNLWNRGTSMFKRAAVMGNASVVIQQPTAMMRAMAMINPIYFAGGKTTESSGWKEFFTADYKDMMDHSAVANIKQMGGFDTNTGRSAVDWMLDEKTKAEKAADIMGKGAEFADVVTWVNIWNAVKRETKAKHQDVAYGSDEYYEICEKRFRDVVDYTQVYDSTLSKSELMRGQSGLTKMVTAFMAEPTLSFNLLTMSGKGRSINTGRAIAAFLANVVVNSAFKAIVGAWRDKDEDETYREKWIEKFMSDLVGDKNVLFLDGAWSPVGMLPWIKDLMSMVQGYNVDRSDVSVFSDLISAVQGFAEGVKADDGGLQWPGKDAIVDIVGAISAFTPVPLAKIMQDAEGIVRAIDTNIIHRELHNTAMTARDAVVKGLGFESSRAKKAYDAARTGNKEYIRRLTTADDAKIKEYRDKRYSVKDAIEQAENDAMRSYYNLVKQGMLENEPRVTEAAVAVCAGQYQRYEQLRKEMIAEGLPEYAVQSAIDSLVSEMRPADTEVKGIKDKAAYTTKNLQDALRNEDVSGFKYVADKLIEAGTEEDTVTKAAVDYAKDVWENTNDVNKARWILTDFAGLSWDKAETKIGFWKYQYQNPDGTLDASAYETYYTKIEPSGITVGTYETYTALKKDAKGTDANGDGKADSGTVKAEVLQIIDRLPITNEQKDFLYMQNGWAESKLQEAPWHKR